MSDMLEDELRATLRAVADGYTPAPRAAPAHTRPPRLPAAGALAAAAALVLVVGIGITLVARGGGDPVGVDVGGSTVPSPLTTAGGGSDDSPWRTGRPAPISTSVRQLSVWTGTEVLVWSSTDGGVGGEFEGAAYEPAADRWRELGPIELGRGNDIAAVVWAGDRAVFYVDRKSPYPGIAELRALDPDTGEWDTQTAQYALPVRFSRLHVIDGDVVVEVITEDAQRAVLTDDGSYEIVDRSFFPTDGSDAAFATLEPTYELITVEPVDIGEELVVGRVDFDTGTTRWTVHSSDAVTSLPPNPDDPGWWAGATAVWTGSEVIVWGGFSCDPAGECAFGDGPSTPFVLKPT